MAMMVLLSAGDTDWKVWPFVMSSVYLHTHNESDSQDLIYPGVYTSKNLLNLVWSRQDIL